MFNRSGIISIVIGWATGFAILYFGKSLGFTIQFISILVGGFCVTFTVKSILSSFMD